MALSSNDPTSFSNPEEVAVKSIDLDLEVDFDKKTLSGTVHLNVVVVKDGASKVVLDTRQMKIISVKDGKTGIDLDYTLGENVGPFGAKLEISLPKSVEKEFVISVKYETSPDIEALQWLSPSQTAGKSHPYLFSQCEAIHCRSIIPIQDTPSVKFTYTAQITAPSDIQMLMSALHESSETRRADSTKTVHKFRQKIPIPSYLMAIAGGNIVSKEIGPRSKVWTEPKYLEACAHEFSETEAMLQTAENLLGPYVWGHYDLLVLPPSFPYGGMENPCLTFVTPTLLAGDRSLADVVAHEIAHSWTGNLVTNKTFEHFWLNEGNTVFVERKIVSGLKGSEVYRQYLGFYGWEELQECVNTLMNSTPQYTRLVIKMDGIDPDESFSKVPYEKGCAFLFYLESILGGPDAFNPFLKAYIQRYQYQSVTTEDWKSFLYEYFQDKKEVLDNVDWPRWLEGEGMPPIKPRFDESLVANVRNLVERWMTATDDRLDQFVYSDVETFVTKQTEQFLHFIHDGEPLSRAKIIKMGDVYKFKDTHNSEIRKRWAEVCIKAQYEEIIPSALQFVTEQGRMKFVIPIYRALFGWEKSRQRAIDNFIANRDTMHGITATKVEKLIKDIQITGQK